MQSIKQRKEEVSTSSEPYGMEERFKTLRGLHLAERNGLPCASETSSVPSECILLELHRPFSVHFVSLSGDLAVLHDRHSAPDPYGLHRAAKRACDGPRVLFLFGQPCPALFGYDKRIPSDVSTPELHETVSS